MHLPGTKLVYRELVGQWYEIRLAASGQVTLPLDVPRDVCDHIPVEQIVEAYYCPPGAYWEAQEPEELPIVDIVRPGLERNWQWSAIFESLGLPSGQAGFLFEKFVAATVLAFGIKNVRLNLKLTGGERKDLHEVDVVANHHSRLYFIDCKLRSEAEMGKVVERITSQIRQADSTRRTLGGPDAKMLLIRPGYAFREEEQALAEAYGIATLDRNMTLDFFRELAKFLNFSLDHLPEQVPEAQALLDNARKEGYTEAFATTPRPPQVPASEPLRLPLRISYVIHDTMLSLNQDWLVYEVDDKYLLVGNIPNDVPAGSTGQPPSQLVDACSWLEDAGFALDWSQYRRSKLGNTFYVPLKTFDPRRLNNLRELLAAKRGVRIFS